MLLSSGAYKNLPFYWDDMYCIYFELACLFLLQKHLVAICAFFGQQIVSKVWSLWNKLISQVWELGDCESWVSVKVKVNMKLLNHKSRAGDCFECEFYVWFVGENWVCGSMKWKWKYGILATAWLSEYENSADFRGYSFSLSDFYSS